MVAVWACCAILILAVGAESLHAARCRRLAHLAFGPQRRPARWAQSAPLARVLAVTALCWGMITLMTVPPKIHKGKDSAPDKYKHLVIVLDVSPSMRLDDAGPDAEQTRTHRARDVLESIFERTPIRQFRTSVVATYTGAEPVVIETTDGEVVRNILEDLPLYSAFKSGKTDLFAGLKKGAEIAHPFPPRSTTLMLVSDGDTVPATGMPDMPAAIGQVLVVGVGDPLVGKFIDGHQSRQDVSTLRQIAIRLGGAYHDGNKKHLSTDLARLVMQVSETGPLEQLTRREYALIACAWGASVLALLPWLLHMAGTRWRPGVHQPAEEFEQEEAEKVRRRPRKTRYNEPADARA